MMIDQSTEVKWIKTGKQFISPSNSIQTKGVGEKFILEKFKHAENFARGKAEPVHASIKSSMPVVLKNVNDLRKLCSLPLVNFDESQFIVLNDDNFTTAYKMLDFADKSDPDLSDAVYSPNLDPILIRSMDIPKYLQVDNIFHEFVHKYIDRKVRVYTGDNDGIVSEFRRGGLRVTKFTNKEEPDIYDGDLLNELGNYAGQKKMILDLLKQPQFQEEAERRVELIKSMGIANQDSFILDLGNLGKIRFDTENIHFDNKSLALTTYTQFLGTQLVGDISKICGQIDGLSFEDALIKAKADPAYQTVIRNAFDTTLGKGFYKTIKETPFTPENIFKLIVKVQQDYSPQI